MIRTDFATEKRVIQTSLSACLSSSFSTDKGVAEGGGAEDVCAKGEVSSRDSGASGEGEFEGVLLRDDRGAARGFVV